MRFTDTTGGIYLDALGVATNDSEGVLDSEVATGTIVPDAGAVVDGITVSAAGGVTAPILKRKPTPTRTSVAPLPA